jgi:hypothetical protein
MTVACDPAGNNKLDEICPLASDKLKIQYEELYHMQGEVLLPYEESI